MLGYSESEILSRAAERWGIPLHKAGREYHGPCPFCGGGDDRFMAWPEGNYWCRVCGKRGQMFDGSAAVTARDLVPIIQERKQKQQEKLSAWKQGHRAGYAEGWHDAMALVQRDYWHSQGITDQSVDRYVLGYCPKRQFEGENHMVFTSDAYTIPHWEPDTWSLVNIQYRINQLPPTGSGGKYRQEAGLPPASFFTLPEKLTGPCILVEGAKKAIVLSQLTGGKVQVVGWPGAMPGDALYEQLFGFETIWLIMDPGAGWGKAVERAVKLLGNRVQVVEMPVKPDDAVVQYGMRLAEFRSYLAQARAA